MNEITQILVDCRGGDAEAFDRLMPHVYDELRRRARHYLRGERTGHTLQTTELVHEAYLKLIDAEVPWVDRGHFFAVAARSMRRILVDHARAHRAERRGGGLPPLTLGAADEIAAESLTDLLVLNDALEKLSIFDKRKGRMLELRVFAGATNEEIGRMLDVSVKTVERDMRLTRAWMRRELGHEI